MGERLTWTTWRATLAIVALIVPLACHPAATRVAAPVAIAFGDARAEVQVEEQPDGLRIYRLSTTAKLRDDKQATQRVIRERAGAPRLRSGNAMFDALHALALEEVREASVASIRTDDFDDGKPITCAPGGCFETGQQWTYVWTRDTAYSTDLALAMIDPTRARNSLEFKLSERRGGGGLEIVQDTGSGGSWPVSTDRVAWALGAAKLLLALDGAERVAFRDRAFEAIRNTIERDRLVAFDPVDNLYRGEQSFLDWRAQTYPPWTATDTLQVGLSKSLSTNVVHYVAISLAADLAHERAETTLEQRYRGWAEALRQRIRVRFWLSDAGLFATFIPGTLDPAPVRRFDLLGEALAVVSGIADEEQAKAILRSYPHAPFGPPVVWPQERDVAVYHNRAVWPFVTAYWLLAARRANNDAVADLAVESLMRGAALTLSNMENFELVTGDTAAPVVDSQRQLWSVAGYLAMAHDVIFGREVTPEGIRFRPYITRGMHRALFAATDALVLDGLTWRGRRYSVTVRLPQLDGENAGGAYRIASVRANGRDIGDRVIPADGDPQMKIEITLAADTAASTAATHADVRELDAPRIPSISRIESVGGGLRLTLDAAPDERARVTLSIYRDGHAVAPMLAGDTLEWTDTTVATANSSPCYVVEARYRTSGNASHHSPPVCWWGSKGERVRTFALDQDVQVDTTGDYLVQLVGANPGDVTTGVTCAVARVTIAGADTQGYVFMPHGGSESSYVRVHLEVGKRYRVAVDRDAIGVNMSAFAHFAHYTRGRGGRSGEDNTMRVDGVRVYLK